MVIIGIAFFLPFFWIWNSLRIRAHSRPRQASSAASSVSRSVDLDFEKKCKPVAAVRGTGNAAYLGQVEARDNLAHLMLPATAIFEYVDSSGVITLRTVDIRTVENYDGSRYLHGKCHHRKASRTFRVDRIPGRIYHPDSSRYFRPVDFFQTAYANEVYRSTEFAEMRQENRWNKDFG